MMQRIAGDTAHLATLYVGLVVARITDTETWPGFTSLEICIACERSPGALGCQKVESVMHFGDKTVTVCHSNQV